MSGRFSLIIEKRFCAECSLALSWSVGKRDGGESLDWENGRITIDFDGSKITVDTGCTQFQRTALKGLAIN
jgi:hypothetical protein